MHEEGTQHTPLRYTARAQERLVPRASLSLGSAPDRPLLGLFKSSSGALGIWDGQHATPVDRGRLFGRGKWLGGSTVQAWSGAWIERREIANAS
jgi:hypothetical protein